MTLHATVDPRIARVRAVLWNIRAMAFFTLGPAIGVLLGAVIFGLPAGLRLAATAMFGFSLFLCCILARAEWRSLARADAVRFGAGPS